MYVLIKHVNIQFAFLPRNMNDTKKVTKAVSVLGISVL